LGDVGLSPKRKVGATKKFVASANVVFGCSRAAAGGAAGCNEGACTPNEYVDDDVGAAALSPPVALHQQGMSSRATFTGKDSDLQQ